MWAVDVSNLAPIPTAVPVNLAAEMSNLAPNLTVNLANVLWHCEYKAPINSQENTKKS